jgi:excisionase family DNA binding protein
MSLLDANTREENGVKITTVSGKDYVTPEGAAALLGLSLSTLWRRVGAGKLTAWKIMNRTVFVFDDVKALLHPEPK